MTEPTIILTPEQLALLRGMINELDDSNGWTDERLHNLADANRKADGSLSLRSAAAGAWELKAANYVEAVNISESGSSRSNAAMFDHAMAMVKRYGGSEDTGGTPTIIAPQSTRIVRPTRGG